MAKAAVFLLIFFTVVKWDQAFVHGQSASWPGPEAFFSEVENSVKLLASSALDNYRSRSDLWSTCNTECSVYSCQPLRLKAENSQCLVLTERMNDTCQLSRTDDLGCSNVTFSKGSYIRLPAQVEVATLSCDAQMTICAQRKLDQQAFEQIYVNDNGPFNHIAWSFYGASNGVFRIYPGLEQPAKDCGKYDPRKRPWYKAVTGVSKQVVVLLDTGGPMANTLSLAEGSSSTVLTAARNIVIEFLDTVNKDDTVSVYTFNNSGATIIDQKVTVVNGTELQSLNASLRGTTTNSIAAKANLTAALESVLLHGGFEQSTSLVESLKVIIVITAGDLADGVNIELAPSIIQSASTNQVRTFIYRLNASVPQEDASNLADLQSVACSIGGTYNEIPLDTFRSDPLSTLGSFITYVAALRFDLDAMRPSWVPSFDAFSAVGDVMAVVYPVFDGNFLVGVAGIELLTDAVEQAWPGAITKLRKAADTKHSPGEPLNCSLTTVQKPVACSDDGPRRGLCLDPSLEFVDSRKTYADRTCCDSQCYRKDTGLNLLAIIWIVVGAVVGAVLLFIAAVCLYRCCRWRSRRPRDENTVQSVTTPSATPPSDSRKGPFDISG
ncbi:hypothetical protein R1flu_026492 [Riccia fluitans]|uniref:VWFA domain-containing protein n=1 Tax=Riccia fluitans TaxID=41844 RepID=A0ABD1XGQ0_9MARC